MNSEIQGIQKEEDRRLHPKGTGLRDIRVHNFNLIEITTPICVF